MRRRDALMGLGLSTVAALAPQVVGAVARPVRNVVLVHGLYADGSCWSDVIGELQSAGLEVISVQNPLTTMAEAAAAVRSVISRQDGRTVLVGHSFGGSIVSEVGDHPLVSSLVYVAARAPDAAEDFAGLAKRFPVPPASAGIVFQGEEGRLSEAAFLNDFAGDVPRDRARILFAVQQPFRKTIVSERTQVAAWRAKPNYYAVSALDRVINPAFQRFMAKRMQAHTIELQSSHLSPVSHPREISDLIKLAAARG